ncbi:class I SAM-dependent methyltransferase [Spirillospora albida]|uniref:class I SAM-dependent methyltransferase n=1 Tax=Spirillospora albida TaxID=58123 RepID=UPI0004C266F9|nr:methyltransferase domain-containing protein [Spirillospora albida]
MTVAHDEKVVQKFSRQAAGFTDPWPSTGSSPHLERLVRFMEPELDLDDVVLEVAAGTGTLSRAIAHRVRHATALDLVPDLLAEGKREADHAGLVNVTFTHGDATALPYLDRSFTLVVTPFSLHRAADPEAVVRELARVSRPGAAVIIADVVRPEGQGDPNRIERLRDPAHRALRTADEIRAMLAGAGAEPKRSDTFDHVRPLAAWLESARTPDDAAARIRRELEEELGGGPATGMRPVAVDGELHVTRTLHFQHAIPG